jgi:hypothetical protein
MTLANRSTKSPLGRTLWSLSNAFTSAFKELDPIPRFEAGWAHVRIETDDSIPRSDGIIERAAERMLALTESA